MEITLMREKTIEHQLVMAAKAIGGIAPKLVSPGFDGMPDRLVLLPGGRIGFVEVKAPGKTPRPLQTHRHRQLRALGFPVFVLDDPERIPWILEEVAAWRT
jgi:hypothetical protein